MSKRILLLITAMLISGGIYSDVGLDELSNVSDEFFAKAAQQQRKSDAKKYVMKAEKYYMKAMDSYKNGNKTKAAQSYAKALHLLSMVDSDVALNDDVVQYYTDVFTKLNRMLNDDSDVVNINDDDESVLITGANTQYTIPMDKDNRLVQRFITLYSSPGAKERIELSLKRSGKYRDMILRIFREYDLPDELINLPIVESLYNNNCLSRAGALGIWQIMPHRARALGLKVNYWVDERKDPEKATRAAAQYLRELYVMFDDWHLALSAYNRGEFGLGRDLTFAKATTIEQMSERKAVPRETELYVPQFIATTLLVDNAQEYNIKYEFEEAAKYDEVVINDVTDLNVIAQCAGTTVEKVKELNPSLSAWCTPHNYPNFILKLPQGTKDSFSEKIVKVEDLNPSRGFVRYRVQKGDCLEKIAKKFRTNITALKEDNKLSSKKVLRINQCLVVRPGKNYFSKAN